LDLSQGEPGKLGPLNPGSGSVQDKDKALLSEIIAKLNDLFTGDLTDDDKVIYVRSVIRGKLLESTTLQQQASANSKEQFGSSPDLGAALMDAIISALDAHTSMSSQALGSESIRNGMKEILLNQTDLYEELRERAAASA
jgi:type I restriction enzyme R subunit